MRTGTLEFRYRMCGPSAGEHSQGIGTVPCAERPHESGWQSQLEVWSGVRRLTNKAVSKLHTARSSGTKRAVLGLVSWAYAHS